MDPAITNLLVWAVLLGLIPAIIAHRKGYNFFGWWLFGAAMWIVALPVSVLMKPNPDKHRQCPLCRTTIDAEARVCPQCGRDIFEYLASQAPARDEAAPPL